MHTCTACQAIDTEHYTYLTKLGKRMPFGKCKKCHNLGKYTKKPTGWTKLSAETIASIREQLSDRTVRIKSVAEQFDIPASTLQNWIKKGILS